MEYYKLIIATFIVTGLWDVMLRFISLNNDKIPMLLPDFIVNLKPYFQHHTLLSAAL